MDLGLAGEMGRGSSLFGRWDLTRVSRTTLATFQERHDARRGQGGRFLGNYKSFFSQRSTKMNPEYLDFYGLYSHGSNMAMDNFLVIKSWDCSAVLNYQMVIG